MSLLQGAQRRSNRVAYKAVLEALKIATPHLHAARNDNQSMAPRTSSLVSLRGGEADEAISVTSLAVPGLYEIAASRLRATRNDSRISSAAEGRP